MAAGRASWAIFIPAVEVYEDLDLVLDGLPAHLQDPRDRHRAVLSAIRRKFVAGLCPHVLHALKSAKKQLTRCTRALARSRIRSPPLF